MTSETLQDQFVIVHEYKAWYVIRDFLLWVEYFQEIIHRVLNRKKKKKKDSLHPDRALDCNLHVFWSSAFFLQVSSMRV